MRLEKFEINKFRSIDHVSIDFPKDKPIVLFGPNNVGKSNILKALDYMLGERYPATNDFPDSDYFERSIDKFPNIFFKAIFDNHFYSGNSYNPETATVCFSTNRECEDRKEHMFHYDPEENDGEKMFLSNDDRVQCQFILVDATRDIGRQLSYYSPYSVLSKMAKRMHLALAKSAKDKLDECFKNIQETFHSVPEYKEFYNKLQMAFDSNVDGFEHKLEIDLSAYDPNNYFNCLKIIAKEGDNERSFDEFGSGEQQILLMSFIKAYAETFKGENFILGIEEPEAHLHPLAQRWLAKNLNKISSGSVQIIITTHSPEFLDILNLEGFVKVYKDSGLTKTIQNSAVSLAQGCIDMKANS